MPTLITQGAYATGDQFSIAAMLLHDPTAQVLISKTREGEDKHTKDHSDGIKQFYMDSGISEDRIHTAELDDIFDKQDLSDEAAKRTAPGASLEGYSVKGVSEGTDYVAANWRSPAEDRPDIQSTVRNAWGVANGDRKDQEVQNWLQTKGLEQKDIEGKKVAVLWSRFSGKGGEAHPEHDTSHEGMREMVDRLSQSFDTIIIVGDRHPHHPKAEAGMEGDPYTELVNKHLGGPCKVVDLAEFWKVGEGHDKETLTAWTDGTRTGQFRLYDHLNANSAAMVHIGARSGNLEAMAMMGHQVGYLEQKHSLGGPRMDAWSKKEGLGYDKILVDKMPTRTGKFLTTEKVSGTTKAEGPGSYQQHKLHKLSSLPGKKDPPQHKLDKDPGIERYQKGFMAADLASIDQFARISALKQQIEKLGPTAPGFDRGDTAKVKVEQARLDQLETLQRELENVLEEQLELAEWKTSIIQQGYGDVLEMEQDVQAAEVELAQAKEHLAGCQKAVNSANAEVEKVTPTVNAAQKRLNEATDAKKKPGLEKGLGILQKKLGQVEARFVECGRELQDAQERLAAAEHDMNRHTTAITERTTLTLSEFKDVIWEAGERKAQSEQTRGHLEKLNQNIRQTQQMKQELARLGNAHQTVLSSTKYQKYPSSGGDPKAELRKSQEQRLNGGTGKIMARL